MVDDFDDGTDDAIAGTISGATPTPALTAGDSVVHHAAQVCNLGSPLARAMRAEYHATEALRAERERRARVREAQRQRGIEAFQRNGLVPGNPGNSGGKKGRSGRHRKRTLSLFRALTAHPEAERALASILFDPDHKHFAAIRKHVDEYTLGKIAPGEQPVDASERAGRGTLLIINNIYGPGAQRAIDAAVASQSVDTEYEIVSERA